MNDLQDARLRGVYFFIPDKPFMPDNLHYAAASLAEGLGMLGVPAFSNVEGSPFKVLEKRNIGLPTFIFAVTERAYSPALIDSILKAEAPKKLVLSMADTVNDIILPDSIPGLMTHENRFIRYAGRRFPWAFGLDSRRIEATAGEQSFEARVPKILCNFRPSLNQDVRRALELAFIPLLGKYFYIDRHISSDHNQRLRNYVGCLAYGGTFLENLGRNPNFQLQDRWKRLGEHATFSKDVVVARWDSWRWWESLSAGCLTFHLDFEEYGFRLPVNPKGWEHYVPISLADPKGTVERLMDEKDRWAQIAANGRQWAWAHYRPEAVAARFLDFMAADPWGDGSTAAQLFSGE